jgi:hypothetical protein
VTMLCVVTDCDAPRRGTSAWCDRHRRRVQKFGDPNYQRPSAKCMACGALFITHKSSHRYCSRPCFQRAYTPTQVAKTRESRRRRWTAPSPRSCAECGSSFIPARSDQKYCSYRCGSRVGNRRWYWANHEDVKRRQREWAAAKHERDPRMMFAGELVRVSELPPELQPVARVIRETRRLLGSGQPKPIPTGGHS